MKKNWIAITCLFTLPLFAGTSNHPECKEEDFCKLPTLCPAKKPASKMKRRNARQEGREGRRAQSCETECEPCEKPCVNPCVPKKEKKKQAVCGEPCIPFCPIEETLPNRRITPPILPNVSCGWDIEVSADFIWWTTFIDNTEYGATNIADGGPFVPFGTSVGRGTLSYPNFKFEPGFKIGVGASLGHDGWDIFANYTWISNGNDLVSHLNGIPGEGAVVPFMAPEDASGGGTGGLAQSAASSFSQTFNVLDIELGRAFFISRQLILRPFTGVKGAWIHNSTRSDYSFLLSSPAFDLLSGSTKIIQSMGGVGIRSGLNSDWLIWRNLGLYANLACTLLWSDFHCKEKDFTDTTGIGNTVNFNFFDSRHAVNTVLEAGLGLSYVMWSCDNSFRYQFQLGWEEQVWFDFNQSLRGIGNMSLHGLTANANFTF